jgi:hypothetical protein
MAELITENQPRIKFRVEREGETLDMRGSTNLRDLAELMSELEQAGVIPVLNDGEAARHIAFRVRSGLFAMEEEQREEVPFKVGNID